MSEERDNIIKLGIRTEDFEPDVATLSGGLITEDGTALAFADVHKDKLRFDNDTGNWLKWAGTHWKRDETQLAFSWARDLARDLAATIKKNAKLKYAVLKISFAAAVERGARADQRLGMTQAMWDTDKYLLGTPEGTVDLRTGKLREARQEDYITKVTAVAPKKMKTPLWRKFLEEATNRDAAVIRFLQIVCGYALTGEIREHLLMFVYGPGGNGKTTFLNTVAHVFGDYAMTAAMDTFTASEQDKHPTDMAMLRGARLVTAAETREGRHWDETRIKQFTGGDKITAHFMRQDNFTYIPELQLVIIGNYKPRLVNVGEAIRRRLAIVPFVFKPEKPDLLLEDKLKEEAPGILRWLIAGCLRWQRGLKKGTIRRPMAVRTATEQYLLDEDLLLQWIDGALEQTGRASDVMKRSAAYQAWKAFAEGAGGKPQDLKWFVPAMTEKGFETGTGRERQSFVGVRWKPREQVPF
jgi:putative DNA primase/helicase